LGPKSWLFDVRYSQAAFTERAAALSRAQVQTLFGRRLLSFNGFVRMILYFCFVLDDLAVDFVGEQVDGGVQIAVSRGAMDIFAAQPHGDFSGMFQTFYRDDYLSVDDIVEMPRNPGYFVQHVFTNRRSYFKVTTDNA
jgi:hypothetical protein